MAENHCSLTHLAMPFMPEESVVANLLIHGDPLCWHSQGLDEAGLSAMRAPFEAFLRCAKRLQLFFVPLDRINAVAGGTE